MNCIYNILVVRCNLIQNQGIIKGMKTEIYSKETTLNEIFKIKHLLSNC